MTRGVDRGMSKFARAWMLCCCCGLLLPSAAGAEPPGILPLTRVRLYEAGVGYFERSGRLRGGSSLPIPATQLDDALKTLVILDDDKDRKLEGVSFDTRVTEQLGRALARLPTDSTAALDLEALARSLTGAEVELQLADGRHRGRLLQVLSAADSGMDRCLPGIPLEPPQKPSACVLQQQPGLILLREGVELMRVALSEVKRLRPTAASDTARLRAALEASPAGRATVDNLQIRGKLSDRVTLGYVAEAPLWRTTYRLVLGESGVWLQAWALLHNDSDENWNDVRVELVNGQPDSFLFPFAAPRYARRRLVTPLNELPSVPQLLSGSADALWDRGEESNFGAGGLGLVGYGSGSGGFVGRSSDESSEDRESSLLAIGDLAASEAASGEETGALFRYVLPAPIALGAHDSLLVPLLHEQVTAERVSFIAADSTLVQSALVLGNTTRQTLPEGTIAIFEAGGFGGESALDRIKPGEQRRISFGRDLDLELDDKGTDESVRVRMISRDREALVVHYERTRLRRYTLRNRAAAERTVQLALSVVNNARVERADALLVLDDDVPCAVFKVAPATTRSVQLDITEGIERKLSLAELGSKGLLRLASTHELPQAQRAALNTAAGELAERERRALRKRQLTAEIELLQRTASRTQQSLPIVAKADPERGRALASELVRTQAKLNASDRERAALNLQAPWRAALAALETLTASK